MRRLLSFQLLLDIARTIEGAGAALYSIDTPLA